MQNDYDWMVEVRQAIKMLVMAKNMAPNTNTWETILNVAIADAKEKQYGYMD